MSGPDWEPLFEKHPFDERTLAETLIGGQAFRWYHEPETGTWLGMWESNVVRLRLKAGAIEVQRLTRTRLEEIRSYLGVDRIEALISALPCNADPVLEELHQNWSGLSILRQAPGETLLAFICSSNKQILQIRVMLHKLSERFGSPIQGTPHKALPLWSQLAGIDEEALRECALGYRARHIEGTATYLAARPGYLEQIASMPLADARESLLKLPGVGPKVAECILLFGYGRMEAFPVDTWIAKLMTEHYPDLKGWSRPQIATFSRLHFGRAAGLAQQWLFAERTNRAEEGYAKFCRDVLG